MCSIYKKTIEFLERAKNWQIGVSIFLNVSFYYAIFALNKLMINEKHKLPKLKLAFLNYTTTFVVLLVCNRVGCFKFVRMPILKMLPLAVFYCASVILTNYSYLHNPLDAYHLIKASSTILVILLSWIFYSYRYSWKILSTVVIVIFAVFFYTNFDLVAHPIGIAIGLGEALCIAIYQVLIGEKQKEFNVSPIQLLAYQAPLISLILGISIPFLDPIRTETIFGSSNPILEWTGIIVSLVGLFIINTTMYWIIGISSALTYNMTEYLKLCVLIVGGSLLFQEHFSLHIFTSIAFILFGLAGYSKIRMSEIYKEEIKNHQLKNGILLVVDTGVVQQNYKAY